MIPRFVDQPLVTESQNLIICCSEIRWCSSQHPLSNTSESSHPSILVQAVRRSIQMGDFSNTNVYAKTHLEPALCEKDIGIRKHR